MKKNKKLELRKETITILDKMQTVNVFGGLVQMSKEYSCTVNSFANSCHNDRSCGLTGCPPPAMTDCCPPTYTK